MKRFIGISFLLCHLGILLAYAQISSDDYFHKSANLYINAQKKEAQNLLKEALAMYPNDERLKKLANAVNDLPDQDQQNQQNQEDQQKQEQQQDQQQQNQQDQQQDEQQQEQQQQPQAQEPQLSKENAQQILDALLEDEKDTQEKVKKQKARATRNVEKDW